MSICIQREGRRVVSQVPLYGLDIVPGPEGGHGIAVSQIVEPCVRQTDRGGDPLEVVIDRVR